MPPNRATVAFLLLKANHFQMAAELPGHKNLFAAIYFALFMLIIIQHKGFFSSVFYFYIPRAEKNKTQTLCTKLTAINAKIGDISSIPAGGITRLKGSKI